MIEKMQMQFNLSNTLYHLSLREIKSTVHEVLIFLISWSFKVLFVLFCAVCCIYGGKAIAARGNYHPSCGPRCPGTWIPKTFNKTFFGFPYILSCQIIMSSCHNILYALYANGITQSSWATLCQMSEYCNQIVSPGWEGKNP